MRKWWTSIPALAALLAVTGCYTSNHVKIKPPKHEEVLALPPTGDNRFEEPPKYPKEYLNQESVKRTKDAGAPPPPTMRSGGAGGAGRMGSPGGGY